MKKELDFKSEAYNMRRLLRISADDGHHTCSGSLHGIEYAGVSSRWKFLDGINISNTQKLTDEGYNLKLIAMRGAILGFKSTFQFGFFHADPHPGNLIVLPENVIGLLDYG